MLFVRDVIQINLSFARAYEQITRVNEENTETKSTENKTYIENDSFRIIDYVFYLFAFFAGNQQQTKREML